LDALRAGIIGHVEIGLHLDHRTDPYIAVAGCSGLFLV
jgi:hypothetical protein